MKRQPGAHDAREKGLRTEAMDHCVHRNPIDQEVTKRSSESRFPFDRIDGRLRLLFEQTSITLNPDRRIISRRLRSEREAEKLGQIALWRADSCKLPVVGTKARRSIRHSAEHDIPRIEIVVNQSLELLIKLIPPVFDSMQ